MTMKREGNHPLLGLTLALFCSLFSIKCWSMAVDDLTAQAEKFLRQRIGGTHGAETRFEITVGPLDRRMRLSACAVPLQFQAPTGELLGRVSIKASCNSSTQGWSLYIPANVRQFRPVVVAAHPISRGSALDASAITLRQSDISTLPQGYFTDPRQLLEQLARRDIAPGEPLRQSLLQPQRLIKRGDEVVILAEVDGLTVRSSGIALADGAAGAQIDIRNLRSERIIRARVHSAGTVMVRL